MPSHILTWIDYKTYTEHLEKLLYGKNKPKKLPPLDDVATVREHFDDVVNRLIFDFINEGQISVWEKEITEKCKNYPDPEIKRISYDDFFKSDPDRDIVYSEMYTDTKWRSLRDNMSSRLDSRLELAEEDGKKPKIFPVREFLWVTAKELGEKWEDIYQDIRDRIDSEKEKIKIEKANAALRDLTDLTWEKNFKQEFKKVADLLGGVYAIKWNANSQFSTLFQEKFDRVPDEKLVYSLCDAVRPFVFIIVNKKTKEILGAFDTTKNDKEFFSKYHTYGTEDIKIIRSVKKFILDNGLEIDKDLAFEAFGLFKEGNGFLDYMSVPWDYKRKTNVFQIGENFKLLPDADWPEDGHLKRLLARRYHSEIATVHPETFNVEPDELIVRYRRFANGVYDFSKVNDLEFYFCDLTNRGRYISDDDWVQIKFNPVAHSIDLTGSVLGAGTNYDFFKVKNVNVSRITVPADKQLNIRFNPHGESINASETRRVLTGDLNFGDVKYLNLENADLSTVTSIKFNPKAEIINISGTKFSANCKMYGLDDCKNPRLKHACSRYELFRRHRDTIEEKEMWLTPTQLKQYCDWSSDKIARWLSLMQHDAALAEYIKEIKVDGWRETLCLRNTPEAIKLFKEKLNDNWLTPSMLRNYCDVGSHDTIEKYLERMQSDKRMSGRIKSIYSNKAKREVLHLHDDEKSITLFQQILKEFKTADLKRGTKAVRTMDKIESTKKKISKSNDGRGNM